MDDSKLLTLQIHNNSLSIKSLTVGVGFIVTPLHDLHTLEQNVVLPGTWCNTQ